MIRIIFRLGISFFVAVQGHCTASQDRALSYEWMYTESNVRMIKGLGSRKGLDPPVSAMRTVPFKKHFGYSTHNVIPAVIAIAALIPKQQLRWE